MKKLPFLLLLGIFAFFPSCATKPTPPAKPTSTPKAESPLLAASEDTAATNDRANASALAFNAAFLARDQKVVANLDAAAEWNEANPEGQPKIGVSSELSVAKSRFNGVVADPMEVAAAANRKMLIMAGKLEEARVAYSLANQQAVSLSDALAQSQAATVKANADRDAAIAREQTALTAHIAQLEANRIANQKVVDDIKAAADKKVLEMRNSVWKQQALWLTIAGAASMLIFIALCWIGGLAGAKSAWPFAVGGPLCWGLAQLVAEAWFKWAALGVLLGGCVVGGYWIWKHLKLGEAKAASDQQAAKVTAVLHDVVPVLDKAYENADAATKSVLDAHVFVPLDGHMNDTEKQTVLQVRTDLAAPVLIPVTK